MEHQKIETNKILFRKEGAPTIIFIHGLGGSLGSWFIYFVIHLIKDYQLLIYDLRGHGKSEYPVNGYKLKNHSEDLFNIINDEQITGEKYIVGYSYGGNIALQYAINYGKEVDKIIILDSPNPLRVDEKEIKILFDLKSILSNEGVSTSNSFLLEMQNEMNRKDIESRQLISYRDRLIKLSKTKFREEVITDTRFTDNQLKSITSKVKLIYATNGDCMDYGVTLLELIPKCAMQLLNADHQLVKTHNKEIIELIKKF